VLHKSSELLEAFLLKQIAAHGELLQTDEKRAKEISGRFLYFYNFYNFIIIRFCKI